MHKSATTLLNARSHGVVGGVGSGQSRPAHSSLYRDGSRGPTSLLEDPLKGKSVVDFQDLRLNKETTRRATESFVTDPSMSRVMRDAHPASLSETGVSHSERGFGGLTSTSLIERAGLGSGARQEMEKEKKREVLRKQREEEKKVQQLRGIFVAFDEDQDGILTRS